MWWLWTPQFNPFVAASGLPRSGSSPSAGNYIDQGFAHLSRHGVQACCQWSPQDGFYHFSENWSYVTGLLPMDCMGNGWQQYWHPYTKTVFEQALQDLRSPDLDAEDAEAITLQGEIMHQEGHWATLELSLIPVEGNDWRSLMVLVADVTEQRQLQEEMQLAQRQAQATAHCRQKFLSNMSHELRTPLNAILGFTQLLQQADNAPEHQQADYLQCIRDSGYLLLHKINDLIELANIDSTQSHLNESLIAVSELVQNVCEMHSHTAFERDITIRTDMQNPQLMIRADRPRLMHCLSHLLSNALTYSPDRSDITLSVKASQRDGVSFHISDQGCGISESKICNIQQTLAGGGALYQADIDNVGIGLAIVNELVCLHDGHLTIESAPGQGTDVSLYLPPERLVSLSARIKPKQQRLATA